MAHSFKFVVEVEVERSQGKFASRDEIEQALRDEIENADPGSLYSLGVDGTTDYDVTNYTVDVDDSADRIKRLRDEITKLHKEIDYLREG